MIRFAELRKNVLKDVQIMTPIGPDEKPINLHHTIQTSNGALAEVTQTFHQQYIKIIHTNPQSIPSGIQRGNFNQWRENYWLERLKELTGEK